MPLVEGVPKMLEGSSMRVLREIFERYNRSIFISETGIKDDAPRLAVLYDAASLRDRLLLRNP